MIVAFHFRVGPSGGPLELVRVPPRRYAIDDTHAVRPDRGDTISADVDPCGVEHACDVCDARLLEATGELHGNWIAQWNRRHGGHQPLDGWWPLCVVSALEEQAAAEFLDGVGHAELCPSCYARHGQPDEWSDDLLDRVYGSEHGPARCYPEASA